VVYKGLSGIGSEAISAEYLREVLGPRLTLELMTDTSEATSYALERLSARLGVAVPEAKDLDEAETLIERNHSGSGWHRWFPGAAGNGVA